MASSAGVRAELRSILEAAGVRVVGEGDTPEEAQAGEHAPDALVVFEPLTHRERDVLEWLALGLSNRAIAERLGISEHTVKFHVAAILTKLGAGSRTEAVTIATRRGLLAV